MSCGFILQPCETRRGLGQFGLGNAPFGLDPGLCGGGLCLGQFGRPGGGLGALEREGKGRALGLIGSPPRFAIGQFALQPGERLGGILGQLAGIITATDIKGEKPMRLVQERGLRHGEITVDDLMTPMAQLEALSYEDVSHAQVGHVVAALRHAGRQHTLVVEHSAGGRQLVRGIFSTSQIARQLGMPINNVHGAPTFSELVTQLA